MASIRIWEGLLGIERAVVEDVECDGDKQALVVSVRPLIHRQDMCKQLREAREQRNVSLLGFADRSKDLTDLFFALGQVANVVGHHGTQASGVDGELTSAGLRQRLDQWEAEILVAMEVLGVAFEAPAGGTERVAGKPVDSREPEAGTSPPREHGPSTVGDV